MKTKYWFTLFFVCFVLITSRQAEAESDISCEQVLSIAQNHVLIVSSNGDIDSWSGARAEMPVEYYGLDRKVSACIFSVLKEGVDLGYLVVSMTIAGNPVVEFSQKPAIHRANIDLSPSEAAANDAGLSLNTSHPLYLGALSYYYELCENQTCSQSTPERHLVEMGSPTIITVNANLLTSGFPQPMSMKTIEQPLAYGYVSGVPNYYNRNWTDGGGCKLGCAPSGAGAVIKYWANRGYTNLIPSDEISMLWDVHYNYMYTNCSGWTFIPPSPYFGAAVVNYANNHGYSSVFSTSFAECATSNWNCYSIFVSEIDNQRPAILTYFPFPVYGVDHTVAGVGYSDNNLIVYDNAWGVGYDTWVLYGANYNYIWVDTVVAPAPDTVPPTTTPSLSGTAGDNGWYISNIQVTLTASDNNGGSGVSQTQYKIDSGTWQTYSAPFTVSTEGSHIVYYKSRDVAGNWESEKSTAFQIDKTAPTGSLTIQGGAPQTYMTLVTLQSQGSDAGSGIALVRFRDLGGSWSAWYTPANSIPWQIAGNHGQTLGVDAQFKDRAGNTSVALSDTILLNLYPTRPSSTNYQIVRSTWGASGTEFKSLNYTLKGTAGQPSMIGVMENANYQVVSGYWTIYEIPERVYLPLITR